MSGDLTELLAMAQQGDKAAREQLVVENAGLVWSIARRYFGRGVERTTSTSWDAWGF